MATPGTDDRIRAARAGSVRATARLLTIVENGGPGAAAVAHALTSVPRGAHVVGITGAPGAGKSTLTGALLRHLRHGDAERGAHPRVAVLAVDPSSPFSGGALLGDRVRMADHATDPGVFIRSLSARGNLGGLSAGAPAAVDVMSALGFDVVIIETVGVGQSEVDIMNQADTVAVVLAPGMGDAVQAAKAGILEIADILVVNKADHEGARTTVRELAAAVALGARSARAERSASATADAGAAPNAHNPPTAVDAWRIPVLSTIAENGSGVPEFAAALTDHWHYLVSSGELGTRQARRARAAVRSVVLERLREVFAGPEGQAEVADAANDVISGGLDIFSAADGVVDWLRTRALA